MPNKGLQQDSHNANAGTKAGRDLVRKSLKELGAGRSIVVDKHGTAIAGNKTLEAAEKLGLPVEVVETEGDRLLVVKRMDLDLEEPTGKARKLAYADNRAGQLGLDWDPEILSDDISAGLDLSDVGLDFAGPVDGFADIDAELEKNDGAEAVIVSFTVSAEDADRIGKTLGRGLELGRKIMELIG